MPWRCGRFAATKASWAFAANHIQESTGNFGMVESTQFKQDCIEALYGFAQYGLPHIHGWNCRRELGLIRFSLSQGQIASCNLQLLRAGPGTLQQPLQRCDKESQLLEIWSLLWLIYYILWKYAKCKHASWLLLATWSYLPDLTRSPLLHLLLEVLLLLQLLHSGLQQHGSANILDSSQSHHGPIKERKLICGFLIFCI